ncbi:MAG: J domain-containing protein [Pseudomonadota bacterium]
MSFSVHSHYQTLGVAPDASPDEVRRAYRKLAQKYHPDRNAGKASAQAAMARVNGAYDVLGDAQNRSLYDAALAAAAARKAQTWIRAASLVPPLTRGSWSLVFGISALSTAIFGFATLYTAATPRPVMVVPARVSQTVPGVGAGSEAASAMSASPMPPVPAIEPWKEPATSQRPTFAATDPVTRLVRDGVKP